MCIFTGNTDLIFFLRDQLELWPKCTTCILCNLCETSLAYLLNDGEDIQADK